MNTKYARLSMAIVLAVALALFAIGVNQAAATHVEPIFMSGNPSCSTLNADNVNFPSITSNFGFKLDGAPTGTFTLTNADGELTGGAPSDPNNSVTISNVEDLGLGQIFDWAATLGIDAVIVKGGDNANAYVYDPEAFGDDDLHAPVGSSGKYSGVSHIEFCYDYELDVEKTANTSFTRTFDWDIEKTVTPEGWDLFTGDSGTSKYTVAVTKDAGTDSDWAVNGTITIENNTPFDATITGVSDVVSPGITASVNCGVSFPYVLEFGDPPLVCTYSTALPDGLNRTNTATVTTSGSVGGDSDDADVIFGSPTTLVNDTINVDDTYAGDLSSFSDSGSTMYDRTFTCAGDEGKHDNTATIVETGDSDDASVTVNCYALTVTKDAMTSFDRDWDWTIEKSADHTNLTLAEGQLFTVNYEVTVDATSADSAWAVNGNISVNNPAPIDATINSVSDLVSPNIAASVDCGVSFPYTLVSGGTLNCTYSAGLPNDADRTNTATATLQNYDYDSEGNATANGTTNFTKTVNVSFASATINEVDECIDVNDTNYGFLGTVCADDPLPHTFTYTVWFGTDGSSLGPDDSFVELVCGSNEHPNVADFVTNDTGATGEDNWTVIADVSCDLGCTLTPGYWKTHSSYGPAPFDDTWAQIGEDTIFFLSGQTYYEVLWTPPSGGNAYYILAHAYIAAELNQLNGASIPPDVLDAFNDATALFNTNTPAQIAALKGKSGNALRAPFIELATILDDYNNGLTGPGHCSE